MPLLTLALIPPAYVHAQGCISPRPENLVLWWDAEDIAYVPFHHRHPFALNSVDRVVGPPLLVATASQSTGAWPQHIRDTRDGRTSFFLDWNNPAGNPHCVFSDHPTLAFTDAMTLEFWMKLAPPAPHWTVSPYPDYILFDKSSFGTTGFMLFGSMSGNNDLYAYIGTGSSSSYVVSNGTSAPPPVALLDGQWHHVAMTFAFDSNVPPPTPGGALKLYIDGQLHGTTATDAPMAPSTNDLAIGRALTNRDYFRGLLDEICFYDRALLESEITSIFQAGAMPKCRPMFPDRRWYDVESVPNSPPPWVADGLDVDGSRMVLTVNAPLSPPSVTSEIRVLEPSTSGSSWTEAQSFPLVGHNWKDARVSGDTVAGIRCCFGAGPGPGDPQRVSVWHLDMPSWNEQTDPNDLAVQGYGFRSIDLDGDLLAVGFDDWYQNQQEETVRVLRRTGSAWALEFTANPGSTTGPGNPYPRGGGLYFVEEFGYSVAIQEADNNTGRPERLFIGEPGKYGTAPGTTQAGMIHVYEKLSGVWSETQSITPQDFSATLAGPYDGFLFGSDIEVDGDRLVASAPGRGVAYVLTVSPSSTVLEGILEPPADVTFFADSSFARPLAIEGDLIVVSAGAGDQAVTDVAQPGAAYAYAHRGDDWVMISKLRHGTYNQDRFFHALALSEGRLYSAEQNARVVTHIGLQLGATSVSVFGPGCGGAVLSAAPGSNPVIGQTFGTVASRLPLSSPTFVLFAFDASFQIPLDFLGAVGCQINHELGIVIPVVNSNGMANIDVIIPYDPLIVGANFYEQVLSFTLPGNPRPVVVTNSLKCELGGSRG